MSEARGLVFTRRSLKLRQNMKEAEGEGKGSSEIT